MSQSKVAQPRVLLPGSGCIAYLVGASELQIVIDITHDPWRKLAEKMLLVYIHELQDMGFDAHQLVNLYDSIHADNTHLQ